MTTINSRITVKCRAYLQTLTKTPAKFQKDPSKIVGGVEFTKVSICQKLTKLKLGKKVKKINLRITAKRHAHFQTFLKSPAKFIKDLAKTVGEVAFTRYRVSKELKHKITKFKLRK